MNAPNIKPRKLPKVITTDGFMRIRTAARLQAQAFDEGFQAGETAMHMALSLLDGSK